jgi:hypothetical protein
VLYRVTIEVDVEAADGWLAWMRAVHVPEVLRERGFVRAVITRQEGAGAVVRFVVDYTVEDRGALERYFTEAAPRIRAEHEARYGGRARATRQILEVVATIEAPA